MGDPYTQRENERAREDDDYARQQARERTDRQSDHAYIDVDQIEREKASAGPITFRHKFIPPYTIEHTRDERGEARHMVTDRDGDWLAAFASREQAQEYVQGLGGKTVEWKDTPG